MNHFFTGIASLLFFATGLFSQTLTEDDIARRAADFEARMKSEESRTVMLQRQSDSLATRIQQLKSDRNLNMFERQRLEQWLKDFQEVELMLEKNRRDQSRTASDYQSFLRDVTAWYDGAIRALIDRIEQNENRTEKSGSVQELIRLKAARKIFYSKLEPMLAPVPVQSVIEIGEFDSYEKIIQKADLLKDQEDKVRKKLATLEHLVKEADNESTLRQKMDELIADTYLMETQSELIAFQSRSDKGVAPTWDSEVLDNVSPTEISLNNFDSILKMDVSDFSSLDLELYRRNLMTMISHLSCTADSLKRRADEFYQAAQQKREGELK